jgi:hypothetical protein
MMKKDGKPFSIILLNSAPFQQPVGLQRQNRLAAFAGRSAQVRQAAANPLRCCRAEKFHGSSIFLGYDIPLSNACLLIHSPR